MKSSLYPAQELKRRTLWWATKLRVNPKMIRVQDMCRKWGSCSSTGTVTLASDLAEQDERFQDFVIVHELLHLRLSTHGRVFKALMSAHIPGWQAMERSRMRKQTVRALQEKTA
ncbi:M48 metallopeptidase family protein [Massilia haematophila]|uniref:M48 family metallopeptidase n=1 Tax=Massilia haematophila TaxID=457923 RepID=A0ABV7PPQ0_9BURK